MTKDLLTADEADYGEFMRKAWMKSKIYGNKNAVMSASPEVFFGFSCRDVREVHFHKHGEGEGYWFRLKDGRVFDAKAEETDKDPTLYESSHAH